MKKILNVVLFVLCALFIFGCNARATSIVRVNEIAISNKNLYLAQGDTTVISAQVYPLNAFNQNVFWVSSNSSVVSVEDGFVVATGSGEATIQAVSDDGGYTDICNVLVTNVSSNLARNSFFNEDMKKPEEFEQYTIKTESKPITANIEAVQSLKELTNFLKLPTDVFNFKKVLPSFALFNSFDYSNIFENSLQLSNEINNNIATEIETLINQIETEPNEFDTQIEKINGVTYVTVKNKVWTKIWQNVTRDLYLPCGENMQTFYEILGVSQNATAKEIKSAYIVLIKKYHPDSYSGNKDFALKKSTELTEAYNTLKNEDLKKKYDLKLKDNSKKADAPKKTEYTTENKNFKKSNIKKNEDNAREALDKLKEKSTLNKQRLAYDIVIGVLVALIILFIILYFI